MENGKRRAEDEGILIEYNNPQKRVRHELIEFEPSDKDGAVMEIEVSAENRRWLLVATDKLTINYGKLNHLIIIKPSRLISNSHLV